MSKGLFSRLEADKFVNDQSSLMDVVNASFIDRSIGFHAKPLEEIGHAGARKATKDGLFKLFDWLLRIILTVLYAVNMAFQKLAIVRNFFYGVGLLCIALLPCSIFIRFYSDKMQFMILLFSIFLMYILLRINNMKVFYVAMMSFIISMLLTLDIQCLHFIYTPFEKYNGTWVSQDKKIFVNVDTNSNTGKSNISSNILKHTPNANYFHMHGYNFLYLYDKNDKSNTYLFLYNDGKLIYQPFFGKHEVLTRNS